MLKKRQVSTIASIVVISFFTSEQPEIPLYGWFIPIFVLVFLILWGLSTIYNSYKKRRAIQKLERERYIREGIMIVCSNCGMETMVKCPYCGKQLYRKISYCSACGKPLEK